MEIGVGLSCLRNFADLFELYIGLRLVADVLIDGSHCALRVLFRRYYSKTIVIPAVTGIGDKNFSVHCRLLTGHHNSAGTGGAG